MKNRLLKKELKKHEIAYQKKQCFFFGMLLKKKLTKLELQLVPRCLEDCVGDVLGFRTAGAGGGKGGDLKII